MPPTSEWREPLEALEDAEGTTERLAVYVHLRLSPILLVSSLCLCACVVCLIYFLFACILLHSQAFSSLTFVLSLVAVVVVAVCLYACLLFDLCPLFCLSF